MAIRKSLLPSAYQQVEYIESNGTGAYIDTGLKPNDNFGLKIKITLTDNTANAKFGVKQDANDTRCWWGVNTSNNVLKGYMGWGTNYPSANNNRPTVSTNVEHIVEANYFNDRKYRFNGTDYFSNLPTLEATYTHSFLLFGVYDGGAAVGSELNYRSERISRATFTSGSSIIMDLIPCYRKSDDVVGMYDIINDTFYTNQGSGTFTKGNDVTPKVKKLIKNNNYVIRAYKGSSLYYNALPSEFKAVEYIESSGLEYIDTGIIPTNDTEVNADFIVVNFNSNVVNYMFGNYEAGKLFALYRNTSDIFGVMFSNYDNFSSYEIQLNTRYKAKLNSTGAYINGSSIKSFTTLPDFTATNSLYIFKGNGSTRPPAILKLYGFTIKESNKVVRKLIPCYRISDTTIGLYDLVNGVFYTNAGTGAFTKGNDI